MIKNETRTKRDNGAGYIYHLVATQIWCAKIQTGYNLETGKPEVKAFYGKTYDEVKLKLKTFKQQ